LCDYTNIIRTSSGKYFNFFDGIIDFHERHEKHETDFNAKDARGARDAKDIFRRDLQDKQDENYRKNGIEKTISKIKMQRAK